MADPQLFRLAAQLIRNRGLIKGSFQSAEGYCIAGALYVAKFGSTYSYHHKVHELDAEAIILAEVIHEINAVKWNDEPERTKEDVIAALEKCAEVAEAKLRKEQHHENRSIPREDNAELVLAL